jgi:signal transduction histidine kinase
VFETQQDIKININTEYLDLSRYNDLDYIRMMVDIFHHKYSELNIDLIITVFEPAFNFVIRYNQELFPDVPIISGGIERLSVEDEDLKPNISGVFQGDNAYKQTLELVLNLHPETRHAVVVAGSGFLEQSWLMPARKTFNQYKDRLEFTYLTGLSLNEIQNKVKKLPTNTVVLYFPVLEDTTGKAYIGVEVLSIISEASSVPVYSFWEIMLGHGIVGGYINSFPVQAKTTAELGLGILEGIPSGDIPFVQKSDLKYMFDWRQLKRWSIPEDKLPPGSIIEFREYSFWEKYIVQIIIIFSFILFQTLIIGYLLIQRKRRRQAEIEAQVRRDELNYVSRLVTLGELSASLAHELNQPLSAILANAYTARRYLSGDQTDLMELGEILDDIILDDNRAADIIKKLRALMRNDEVQLKSFDINEIIQGVVKFINHEISSKNIKLELILEDGLPNINGDVIHLEQVVLNLVLNGIESMQSLHHKSRQLTISTVKHDDRRVRVSVRDQGSGIEESHFSSIFEAFYTTKPEGMGMGLAICRSIIEMHNGQLWAENNPDRGTTFSFTLSIFKGDKHDRI